MVIWKVIDYGKLNALWPKILIFWIDSAFHSIFDILISSKLRR